MQLYLFLFAIAASAVHDLHLSISNIVYNESAQRIEVQQRIFYDDLETSLRIQLQDDNFDILKPDLSSLDYDSLFLDYANKHIEFEINGNVVDFSLLEYEVQDDAIVLYLYISDVKDIQSLKLFSHILFELFDDQDNVVSVHVNGSKKSKKFDVRAKPLELEFE